MMSYSLPASPANVISNEALLPVTVRARTGQTPQGYAPSIKAKTVGVRCKALARLRVHTRTRLAQLGQTLAGCKTSSNP